MEYSLWFGIFVYFALLYLVFFQDKAHALNFKNQFYVALSLLLFLLLVYFPTKKSIALQKQASTLIETDRKGLHYKDFQQDLRFAWRDLQGSTIVLDTHPALGVYPRELRFRHSKGTIVVRNDPYTDLLEGVIDLVEECNEKLPGLKQCFISFTDFCPYCGADKTLPACPSCGREAAFIYKFKRPLTLIKDEILLMVAAMFLLSLQIQTTYTIPVGMALLVVFFVIPFMMMRNRKLKTIREYLEEKASRNTGNEKKQPAADEAPTEQAGETMPSQEDKE